MSGPRFEQTIMEYQVSLFLIAVDQGGLLVLMGDWKCGEREIEGWENGLRDDKCLADF